MRALSLDHIGWAVRSIEGALPAMKAIGFEPAGEICGDASRSVRILLLRGANGGTVELVEPFEGVPTPISNFLAKNGPSPYHCCFAAKRAERDDIVKKLKEAKFAEIVKELPAPALGGDGVIFLYSREIGLIEIVLREP